VTPAFGVQNCELSLVLDVHRENLAGGSQLDQSIVFQADGPAVIPTRGPPDESVALHAVSCSEHHNAGNFMSDGEPTRTRTSDQDIV
jgi:hypothetical protein